MEGYEIAVLILGWFVGLMLYGWIFSGRRGGRRP